LGIKWTAIWSNYKGKNVGGKLFLFKKKTIELQKTSKDFLFGVKCVFFTKQLPLFAIRKNGGKHNLVESFHPLNKETLC
jgi:hypothetical protein